MEEIALSILSRIRHERDMLARLPFKVRLVLFIAVSNFVAALALGLRLMLT
jgi:hypothetical protein